MTYLARGFSFAMLLRKAFEVDQTHVEATDAEMDHVRAISLRKDIGPADVWLGKMRLCNTAVDRSKERFTPAYLDRFKQTIIGRPVLTNHDYEKMPLGRFYNAEVIDDATGLKHLQPSYFLNAHNKEAISNVELGIWKDVSIGFQAGKRVCDLCEKAWHPNEKLSECNHYPGVLYEGKECTLRFCESEAHKADAREGSFVIWGCQPGAQAVGKGLVHSTFAVEWQPPAIDLSSYHRPAIHPPLPASAGEEHSMEMNEALAEIDRLKAEAAERDTRLVAGQKALDYLKAEIARKTDVLNTGRGPRHVVYVGKSLGLESIDELLEINTKLAEAVTAALDPLPGGGNGAPPPEPVTHRADPWRRRR